MLLTKLNKQDQHTLEQLRKRKIDLHDHVLENFSMVKRKVDQKSVTRKNNLTLDTQQQSFLERQAQQHDDQYLIDFKKMQNIQKQEMLEQLKRQELLKKQNRALSKIDHKTHMDGEFDLFSKNQERHQKIIHELTKPKKTQYKNLAIIEKERERKLLNKASKSVMEEAKKRDKIVADKNHDKIKEYQNLKMAHKHQMEEKQLNRRNNSSLEIFNDKLMLDTIQQHEKEIIRKEKLEAENRKQTFKKMLDDHSSPQYTKNFNNSQIYDREFELNKGLIKELSPSPDNSTLG